MATRGRKPNPLRVVTGSHLQDRPPPAPREVEVPIGAVEKPAKMKKPVERIWDKYIARCTWLTWADGPKALMWCHLQFEYEKNPAAMIASRIAQLRALGSELGLDVSSRDRMGIKIATGRQQQAPEGQPDAAQAQAPSDPARKYF